MQKYPIFVDLKNQNCLVVGAGQVALRKIRLMLSAGAKITVIAPQADPELIDELGNSIQMIVRPFTPQDIGDYRLITAATNNSKVNRLVSEIAQARNIPVNVVDQPDLCSFITPSIIDRSPVVIAVSTDGAAPVLARSLRSKIESYVPAAYGVLATTMSSYRDAVKKRFSEESQRREFWEQLVNGSVAEHIFSGRMSSAKALIQKKLDESLEPTVKGNVSLVGSGPGDPDLLTFRALRLMQLADVVLHDRLVSPEILDLCRRDAQRIYVGKQRAKHSVPQGEINQLLVDLALQGKKVVRLKGGDPFIFGRGGEEIELLAESQVPFQVVPGITAASGCASYAGIPLTHRDHAQSCLFVTGHLKDGSVNLDWELLSAPNQTVVIYMGLIGLPTICKKLIENGMTEDMQIALIEQGTTAGQRVFTGTLSTIAKIVSEHDVHAPTLIIVGSVVSLHNSLRWRS